MAYKITLGRNIIKQAAVSKRKPSINVVKESSMQLSSPLGGPQNSIRSNQTIRNIHMGSVSSSGTKLQNGSNFNFAHIHKGSLSKKSLGKLGEGGSNSTRENLIYINKNHL